VEQANGKQSGSVALTLGLGFRAPREARFRIVSQLAVITLPSHTHTALSALGALALRYLSDACCVRASESHHASSALCVGEISIRTSIQRPLY
jgi:hypothetical protein